MKTKTLSLMFASILALVVLAGLGSALTVDTLTITAPANVSHDAGSFTMTLNVNTSGIGAAGNIDLSNTATAGTTYTIAFSQDPISSVTPGENKTVTATITFGANQAGNIAGTIKADADSDKETAFSVPILTSKELVVSDASISAGANSTTITVKNDGNADLTAIVLNSTGDFDVTFDKNNFNLAKGVTETITLTADENDLADLLGGSVTISARASDGTNDTGVVDLEKDYCEYSNIGSDLSLDLEVTNKEGFGDDETWYPFDEIEVDVTVENKGDYDIDSIELEWGLYDKTTKEFLFEESESKFNLKSDKENTLTLSFTLDEELADLDEADLVFYVRATGEYDDSDSTNDGDKTCVESSDAVEVTLEDFMIMEDFTIPETASCDSEIQVSANVWNTGDSDQEEVYVVIYNKDLGINKEIKIGDIDGFDKEKLDAVLTIPANAAEKTYPISFSVYNEDDDIFQNENDDDAEFIQYVTVSGSCSATASAVSVAAALESGGKSGSPLVVKATVSNTGTSTATYTIITSNYDSWADSAELDATTLVLAAGESKDVEITFDVKKDVEGEKTFNLEVSSGNSIIKTQPVAVVIEKASFLSGLTGNVLGGSGQNKWFLWGIGALNVVLVLVIIIVALRVAKN